MFSEALGFNQAFFEWIKPLKDISKILFKYIAGNQVPFMEARNDISIRFYYYIIFGQIAKCWHLAFVQIKWGDQSRIFFLAGRFRPIVQPAFKFFKLRGADIL